MKLFGVDAFTKRTQDFISFTSRIDKKGRALISAPLRKTLGLEFGSRISVKIRGKSFISKIDDRGRFSIPCKVRNTSLFVEGVIRRRGF